MELCETSLDRLYLPEGHPKKYQGPMPQIKDEEFCFQLASGLEFIHRKKLVHGSIKPSNILITWKTPETPQVKLSDFGLKSPSKSMEEIKKSANEIGGFQDSIYWLAPELIQTVQKDDGKIFFTEESDIFSLGRILFYLSRRGVDIENAEVFATPSQSVQIPADSGMVMGDSEQSVPRFRKVSRPSENTLAGKPDNITPGK